MIKNHAFTIMIALAFTLTLTCRQVQAGGGGIAGNGGDVVYCDHPLPGEKQIELLDLFESRVLRENHLVLGQDGWDYNRRVSFILERLKPLDAYRASVYAEHASHFLDESEFTTDQLPDIPDSLHIALPKGCVVRQIVIQRPRPQTGEKRFLVNKPLWEMLDDANRAALVLHETIYREALSLEQSNSINTRLFNETLTSTAFDSLDFKGYLDLLITIDFKSLRILLDYGNWFNLFPEFAKYCLANGGPCNTTFNAEGFFFGQKFRGSILYEIDNGKIYLIELRADYCSNCEQSNDISWPLDGKSNGEKVRFSMLWLDRQMRVISGYISRNFNRTSAHYNLNCKHGSFLSFNNPKVEETCLISDEMPASTVEVQGHQVKILPVDHGAVIIPSWLDRVTQAKFYQPEQFSIRSKTLTFTGEFETYHDGQIHWAGLLEAGELQIPNSSEFVTAVGHFTLYEDGTVQKAKLKYGGFLKNEGGRMQFFFPGSLVEFNREGNANEAYY